MKVPIRFPEKFQPLFTRPVRYNFLVGGRGAGRSWGVARKLLLDGTQGKRRVLCTREYQNSLKESVHHLLEAQIDNLNLGRWYRIQRDVIFGANGTEFIFAGLHHNVTNIKSIEGIDDCWVEEAQSVSAHSWSTLRPTVRKKGARFYITFNPDQETDPTYQMMLKAPTVSTNIVRMNWYDNPWFPDDLRLEMEWDRSTDPDKYSWIWEGNCRTSTEAQVFKGKYRIEGFETPTQADWLYGADWGFSVDPTVLVRMFIKDDCLFISDEAYGVGVEIVDTPKLFDRVPEARAWKIRADSARPETISHLHHQGFNIVPAVKWPGSVEEGVQFLRSFKAIIVHPRCRHVADELRLYSYKQDRLTGDVQPVLLDANNHCIDAIRYALEPIIRRKGMLSVPRFGASALGI